MDLELAIREYLKDIEIRRYTPRTIRGYRNNLHVFFLFAESEGITDTEGLSFQLIKSYIYHYVEKGCKGTYINSMLKTIRSFIKYCHSEDYTKYDTVKWQWVKEDKPIIRAFSPEDVIKMLNNCKGNDYMAVRDKCILTCFFETGIRCSELCNINVEDVHDNYILIHGKNHKDRVVPVTAYMGKMLIKWSCQRSKRYPDEAYYFLSYHGHQLTNSAVEHLIKARGEGIEGVRVSPHTCRHFFAQQQLKMGTDLYTISRLLGHENVGITQTYLRSLDDQDIVEVARGRSVLGNVGQ